jgi:hypothetical protein
MIEGKGGSTWRNYKLAMLRLNNWLGIIFKKYNVGSSHYINI